MSLRSRSIGFSLVLLACGETTPPPVTPGVEPPASAIAPPAPVATSHPQGAPAPRLFDGCTAVSLAGEGWKYECANLVASIGDHDADPSQRLLEGGITAVRASMPGNVELQRGEGTFAGMHALTARITGKNADGTLLASSEQRFFMRPEGSRLVICSARADLETRCQRIVDALSRAPWRPPLGDGASERSLPLEIAGRHVDVPAGCNVFLQQNNAGSLECREGNLMWIELPKDQMDAAEGEMVAKILPSNVRFQESRFKCGLEGVSTTCRRFAAKDVVAVLARATVRQREIFAWCVAKETTTPLPSVCTPIFTTR